MSFPVMQQIYLGPEKVTRYGHALHMVGYRSSLFLEYFEFKIYQSHCMSLCVLKL